MLDLISIYNIVGIILIILISLLGIILTFKVLKKRKTIFYLLIFSFVIVCIEEITTDLKYYFNPFQTEFIILHVLSGICYLYMNFVVNLLYIFRLKSLGGYIPFQKLCDFTPFICLSCGISTWTLYSIYVYTKYLNHDLYIILSLINFSISIILEIFISIILIRKILTMFEYRRHLQKTTILKIFLFLFLIIILEVGIFIIRLVYSNPTSPEGHIRILGFAIRLIILVDFYNDIIYDIQVNTFHIQENNFTFPTGIQTDNINTVKTI
jgi:hypothetical protein